MDPFARTVADALSRSRPVQAANPEANPVQSAPHLDAPALSRRLGIDDAAGDRFRFLQLLGAGGIGRVLLAEDRNLRREVAIKTPLPAQVVDRSAIEAFVTEARVTASLEHPGIAPVHDLDLSSDGQIYYTMRRVHGRTLGSLIGDAIASGRRPAEIAGPNELVNIFLKVCDAIAYAHDRGVIHRDLKPDNIMIGRFGEVLVLDWGASSSGTSPANQGQFFGTPAFMSPEQARLEQLDGRSDVWSLGATLYQALLLRFPQSDADDQRFWQRRRSGELDLQPLASLQPAERPLLAIAARAMEGDLGQRYQSVGALADDLRAYQSGQAMAAWRGSWFERARRWHRTWGRTLWMACAMAATIAVAGWIVWGERLKEVATWGHPMLAERFADGSWQERWEIAPGAFVVQDGRLLSAASGPAIARLRTRIAPPVAVEFEGEMMPGSNPGSIPGASTIRPLSTASCV